MLKAHRLRSCAVGRMIHSFSLKWNWNLLALGSASRFVRTQNACEGICITCTFFCLSLVWHWACRRCRHAHLKSVGELQRKPGQVQKESKLHSFMQFNVFFPLLLLFPCCSRSDQSLGPTTAKTFSFKAVCHFCHTRQTSTEQKRAMQSREPQNIIFNITSFVRTLNAPPRANVEKHKVIL